MRDYGLQYRQLNCNYLFVNMYLKTVSMLLIFLATIASLGNSEDSTGNKFLVVSTTEEPSRCGHDIDHVTKKLQEAINTLHENITNYLQKTKQEIIDQTEDKFKEKFSKMKQEIMDVMKAENLTNHLQKAKQEIIYQTENKLEEKFSKMKTKIVESIQAVKFPSDCKEIQTRGYQDSGVYRIQPYLVNDDFSVFCDMTTRGGGWTYVINRMDGSQDFYLRWNDYENGFGKPSGEYWIGLKHLYYLTNSKPTELLVELVDWDFKKVYAHYSKFQIGSDSDGYKLRSLGKYTGEAGDSLTEQLGYRFSTRDRDQDKHKENCAILYTGAWWYHKCFDSHLTGRYVKDSNPVSWASALHWNKFHKFDYSLKEARMMIRPVNNN